MATPAYEGGIGGKLRKRPLRRPPATPYDRPPSAARGGLRGLPASARGSSNWLSKLVDPVSRVIADGTSRIFTSFFHKRLAAPPAALSAPEEDNQSRQEVPQVPSINPPSELQDQGGNGGDKPTKNPDKNNSDIDGISELEQLLKQKTFTRVEFDHLTELLRSRTVEPVTLEPAVDNEKKENKNSSAQENGVGKSRLQENFSTPAGSLTVFQIPKDEAASPVELAKAYMGSRPLKVSPSTLSLRSQVFQEDTTLPSIVPYVSKPKPFNLSVAPRSVIRFSGIPKLAENSYQTPKPQGRSAICRMSCSPYFKVHPTSNVKGGGLTGDGYTGPSSSQLVPRNLLHSGGREVLKRGSSVLDSDFGSFGPIRRIRQKSSLMSPSKDSQSTPLNKEVIEGSSVHKPSRLDERKYHSTNLQDAENEENKISYASVTPIPPKSSETAMKILQQLDKLVPSPKEKSSELKAVAREESPSNLTHNMLGGRVSRNMEDIDSSKFFNVQDSGSLDTNSDSLLRSLRNSLSEKQYRAGENGPTKPAVSGVNLPSEACSIVNTALPSTDAKPGTRTVDFAIPGSAALPPLENPSFRMSAPEDSLLPDDDNCNMKDASGPLSAKTDKFESKILKHSTAISETAISEKSLMCSSKSMPGSSSTFRETDMRVSGRPTVAEYDIGFTFPVTSGPSTRSQPPPTPTMPSSSLDGSALQKEQTVATVFSFGSKAARTLTFSSTMTSIGDTAGQKIGASDATLATVMDDSNLGKGSEMHETGKLSKSFGDAVSSGIPPPTASAVFGFGASATPSQSNGLLYSSSLVSPVSAAPVVTHFDSRVNSTFSTSPVTRTSTSSPSISSAAPIFSAVNSFQFGSSISMGASVSVSLPVNESDSTNLAATPVKASTFNISSSAAPCTSSFPSTGSSSSSVLTTSAFSSSDSSSSALATSAEFPSAGTSSSSLAPSSTFSSTGRGIFGFSDSAQPSISSFSFASNSSHNSTSTSGATAGSIFGTQSTQSGSWSSQFSESSASQFGSLSSSPTFGLSKTSSAGFGSTQFGSATSGIKPFTSSGVPFSGSFVSSGPSTSSSFVPAAATSLFSPSSQSSTTSALGFTFGSTTTSPSKRFSCGLSSSASSSSSLTFGSSTGPIFSFTSAGSTTSSAFSHAQPVFGMPTPAVGFSSGSPGNDQMNVEDSVTDDTNQAAVPMVSTFGQHANSPAAPNLVFGSATVPSGGSPVFQFVGHQNPSTPESPSPFQAGNLVRPGGGFSVGSGGGDKSGRKFVKVKRDKQRKK